MTSSPRPAARPLTAAWLALALAVALLAVPSPASGGTDLEREREAQRQQETSPPPAPERIHPELAQAFERAPGEAVEALVVHEAEPDLPPLRGDRERVVAALKDVAARTQAPARRMVEARGGHVAGSFWISNMLLVRARPETLRAVSGLPGVARVVPNFTVTAPEPAPAAGGEAGAAVVDDRTYGIDRIGAHHVWGSLGIDGSGVRVATLDTGVDIDHPDLAGKLVTDDPADPAHPGGWMEFDRTGNPVASHPRDSATHGTHVSGTIHGGDASGVAIGVAPGAEMMHGLVIPGGSGSFTQVAAGMQWALDPYDVHGEPAGAPADVVNMSLGGNGLFQEMIAPTRNLRAAGIFPAFAIGNNCGSAGTASPGNVYDAVAVGATDAADRVAAFSCGGHIDRDDWSDPPADWPATYTKPDLSAPGVDTRSAVPGGGYATLSGTSMATPHVAGTVALVLQASGGLDVDDTLDVLSTTAFFDDRHGPDRPNTRYGHGRINALEAVTLVAHDSGITGTVTDATTGAPLRGVRVALEGAPGATSTGADGSYQLRLAPGEHTLVLSLFGYDTATVTVTVVEGAFAVGDASLDPVPTGTIAGTVTYAPSGHGVPGVEVRVRDVPVTLRAVTGTDGTYTITGVPEGTYELAATATGLPDSGTVAATVTAGETATADFALPRPQRVALIGDYGGQLAGFLAAEGIEAESHTWSTLSAVAQYTTVIISYATDPGQAGFRAFLDATDAAGTGVVFLDHAFGTHQGIRLLSRHTGAPASTGSTTTSGGLPTFYEVTSGHPVVGGHAVGDRIEHDTASSAGWVAWFDGYAGDGRQVVADLGRTDATGIRGHGVAVHERGTNRHVLLSSHGVSVTRGPADWSEDSTALFLRALDWVSPSLDEPEARFVLWDLEVSPDVVLGGEDVDVTVGVKNVGDLAGDYTATLRVDGEAAATTTVTLQPGEHARLDWTVTRDDLGTYTVAVGPLSATFRVRPPLVTVEATALDGAGPLSGARVALVDDAGVSDVGMTDGSGRLAFESTDAVASYTVVVRRAAGAGDDRAYLLSAPVTITDDTTLAFAPTAGDAVVADLALDAVHAGHDTTTYLAGEHTGRWAFAHEPGEVVLTPGTYASRHVHTIDAPEGHWWYPTAEASLDWTAAGTIAVPTGGGLDVTLADVRDHDGGEVTVAWDVTDAYGHVLATVLEAESRPFAAGDVVDLDALVGALRAAAEREHAPRLALTAPGGELLRSGAIAWDARPYPFTYPLEDVRRGVHGLGLRVDTGPYADRLDAAAALVLPARELGAKTVTAGGTVEVTVTLDAPAVPDGPLELAEAVPEGFRIVDWTATPLVNRRDYGDGTWTWNARGRSPYRAGDLVDVTYTLRIDPDAAPGRYPLTGETVDHGSGLVRAVAGPQEVNVEE